jgi:hypothetical protein
MIFSENLFVNQLAAKWSRAGRCNGIIACAESEKIYFFILQLKMKQK